MTKIQRLTRSSRHASASGQSDSSTLIVWSNGY